METYSLLREIADSWVLLGMFGFFASAAIWAFLPSQASARDDASLIPFRNETPDQNGDNESHKKSGKSLKGSNDG